MRLEEFDGGFKLIFKITKKWKIRLGNGTRVRRSIRQVLNLGTHSFQQVLD